MCSPSKLIFPSWFSLSISFDILSNLYFISSCNCCILLSKSLCLFSISSMTLLTDSYSLPFMFFTWLSTFSIYSYSSLLLRRWVEMFRLFFSSKVTSFYILGLEIASEMLAVDLCLYISRVPRRSSPSGSSNVATFYWILVLLRIVFRLLALSLIICVCSLKKLLERYSSCETWPSGILMPVLTFFMSSIKTVCFFSNYKFAVRTSWCKFLLLSAISFISSIKRCLL